MKILLDTCMSLLTLEQLKSAALDATWIGELPADPGDTAILALAFDQKRVLVTLDKDFGELAIHQRLPHAGIIRIVDYPVSQHASICIKVIEKYLTDLQEGALITVSPTRTRVKKTL